MDTYSFMQAEPIWPLNLADEVNIRVGFSAKIEKNHKSKICIATSCTYQLFVNDEFIAAGPARTAHGYFRVDEIDLGNYLNKRENFVSILLWSYRVDTYSVPNQRPFLTAEIIQDRNIVVATGIKGFQAYVLNDYLRHVQRYNFQRAFVESYVLDNSSKLWMRNEGNIRPAEIELLDAKQYIPRYVGYPEYERTYPDEFVKLGNFKKRIPEEYKQPWYLKVESPGFFQWNKEQLDEDVSKLIQEVEYDNTNEVKQSIYSGKERFKKEENSLILKKEQYAVYSFEKEGTGMISFSVQCDTACEFFMIYDEMLTDGVPNSLRVRGLWLNKYRLEAGSYDLVFFEPISLKYLNIVMLKGDAVFENLNMIEFKHPPVSKTLNTADEDLLKIWDAAVETYRQNSLDLFMDCPSRERAGWLCDSFFTARVEHCLTKDSKVEKNFLTNFLISPKLEGLPDGMFPMCYPSDHPNARFIPNWAMWLVIQLYEYKLRSNDESLIEAFKERVYALVKYFEKFLNADGLLANLESWVFVEWSFANELVQDVNFPTNMLYAFMLERVHLLYQDEEKLKQSENIKKKIRELSFDGSFFRDRMLKKYGKLKVSDEVTEVCQYYAFFTGTALKKTYPTLWKTLIRDFGPNRVKKKLFPRVYPANAFIGTYLRLELLSQNGYHEQLLDESKDFFLYMAEKTGTLWEHKSDYASLNHGFASHIAVWLDKALE